MRNQERPEYNNWTPEQWAMVTIDFDPLTRYIIGEAQKESYESRLIKAGKVLDAELKVGEDADFFRMIAKIYALPDSALGNMVESFNLLN